MCTAHDVEAVTGVNQPSEDDTSSLFEKLATNSKSVALLSTVPEFCNKSVSAPNTEQNIPMCFGDLYSENNWQELRLLCKRAADELVVTKSEALYLELATRKQSASLEWFEHLFARITASTEYQV